jgi:nicotinate-nucleotide pyrophosphorylase (carboxylating)
MSTPHPRVADAIVASNVAAAIAEDLGSGDITAELLAENAHAEAVVISREAGVICGQQWVDRVFASIDPRIELQWLQADGDSVEAGAPLFELSRSGTRDAHRRARGAELFCRPCPEPRRAASEYAQRVAGTGVRLLDTRKTLPGLREAQKYAVRCGGCHNHRMGLYDAFLIKENHILASGSIHAAVLRARANHPEIPVEVEVENSDELLQAIDAGCERVMLDNFDLDALREAVALTAARVELEASGNVTLTTLRPIAETGVDFISIGALTKDCKALDLSMRLR